MELQNVSLLIVGRFLLLGCSPLKRHVSIKRMADSQFAVLFPILKDRGEQGVLFLTGEIVSRAGFNAGFLALSAIAAAALAFYGLAMPETRPESEWRGADPRPPVSELSPART